MSVLTLRRSLRLALAKSDIYAKHRKKLFEKLKDDIYAHRMFQLMIPEFDLSEGSNINESNVIEWMDKYFKSYAKRNNVDWGILKPYIKWVIIKFSTGGINRWEDIPIRALPDIIKFDKIKKKLPVLTVGKIYQSGLYLILSSSIKSRRSCQVINVILTVSKPSMTSKML